MRLTTKWVKRSVTRGKPSSPCWPSNAGRLLVPRRGYRKGFDDRKEPVTRFARTRLPMRLYDRLFEDAQKRRLTQSKLLRAILESHYRGAAVPRVKAVGPSYAVARELNRIGVNLNQIANLANAARLVPIERLHQVLDEIELALEKL